MTRRKNTIGSGGPRAATLMVQGTASAVGKSLLVTALCRYFRAEGLNVAPFKAQNMALNSAVTADGLEIGRAQAVQAEAAGVEPTADMNPVLLKPEGRGQCHAVVMGRPVGRLAPGSYHERHAAMKEIIAASLDRLRARHDLIVIEGAGSPAEVNLRGRDLVNMHVARLAGAPVLLAGDIDRGGVFAALVGTLALLEPEDQPCVAALVINKFRGDPSLLQPGVDWLAGYTGKPVLGVLPYLPGLGLADEDAVALDDRRNPAHTRGCVDIAVVRLPHISNFDDFTPLEHEAGVKLRYVTAPAELGDTALVIIPGTKSTVADLAWLRATGLAGAIAARAHGGGLVLGVCGGCQMLGERIGDPMAVESPQPSVPGLGLLPLETEFQTTKITARVLARPLGPSFLGAEIAATALDAYEIHMGIVRKTAPCPSPFEIIARNGGRTSVEDGAISADGNVIGTMLHGFFGNAAVRAGLLRALRQRTGLPEPQDPALVSNHEAAFRRLEQAVRDHLDTGLLWRLTGR